MSVSNDAADTWRHFFVVASCRSGVQGRLRGSGGVCYLSVFKHMTTGFACLFTCGGLARSRCVVRELLIFSDNFGANLQFAVNVWWNFEALN